MIIRASISLIAVIGYLLGINYLFIGGGVLCVAFMAAHYVFYYKEIYKLEEKINQVGDFGMDLGRWGQRRMVENISRILIIMIIGGAIYIFNFLWSYVWQAVLWVSIIVGLSDFLYISKFLKKQIPPNSIDGLSNGSKRGEVERAIYSEFEYLRKLKK